MGWYNRGMAKACCYTIGHSTRSIDEFVGLLLENGVETLVDVRRYPSSRRYPQFNKPLLMQSLHDAGITYLHEEALGGRRPVRRDSVNNGWRVAGFRGYADYMQTAPFQEALARLIGYTHNGVPAIMCAEAVPWQCHRQLISDALVVRGCDVRHILGPLQTRGHELTSFAIVHDDLLTYPEHGQPPLPFVDQQP